MEMGRVNSTRAEVENRQDPGVLLLAHPVKQTNYGFRQH